MKLLHVADLHLGAPYTSFGDLGPDRAREVLDAFRRLPQAATREGVDAVLVAGDLFDGPRPDADTLAAVRDVLRRLVDACIPVFMVPGNHDAVNLRLNPYRELARGSRVIVQRDDTATRHRWPVADDRGRQLAEKNRVYVLARPRFAAPVTVQTESGPLHVYGVAYDGAECADPIHTFARADSPGVHVALLHASVRDAAHWRPSPDALAVTGDALARLAVDYIALGDHHRPRMPHDFGGPPACYPGSFAATDLTEAGERGYVVVQVAPGRRPEIEHRASGVRAVSAVELDVSGLAHDVAVSEAAAARLPDGAIPAIRLVGEPSFPLDTDAVTAELRERYGHAAVVDETRYFAAERLDEFAEGDTVAGHVVRLGRRRIREAADGREREIAQRALRAALRALEVE